MEIDHGPSGEFLVVIAALVSFQLAQGKTADELALMAAFFDVLGDNLALISVRRAACGAIPAPQGGEPCKNGITSIDNSKKSV